MRIEENIERSGYFWLPGHDEYKAPGILRIFDGGNISLEIVGSFSNPAGSMEDLDEDMSIGRVVGHVEKAGLVTLENCMFIKRNYAFGGIAKSQIVVNWAILGVAFDPSEEILFDAFSASIEGLDEWLGISGISLEMSDDYKSCSINYRHPSLFTLVDKDGMVVEVQFERNITVSKKVKEAAVRQAAFIKVSTKEPKKPEYFIDVFRKLRDFLSFATGEAVSLHSVSGTNTAITVEIEEGQSEPAKMDIYYRITNHVDPRPKLELHSMLFRYGDIAENLGNVLELWLTLYDTIDSAMGLYFSTKAGAHKYLNSHFLALAQALETLHRRTSVETVMSAEQFKVMLEILAEACPDEHREWLLQRLAYGNEIGLTRRVKRLLEPFSEHFGTKAQQKKLARLITDTRNYLTHYDKKLLGKAAKGRDLWVVSQKMEALFQLHLLKTLNFSDEQVETICFDRQALSQKLKLQFDEQ